MTMRKVMKLLKAVVIVMDIACVLYTKRKQRRRDAND